MQDDEHPHAGRIAAVAHLSAARALIDCARGALEEHGLNDWLPSEAERGRGWTDSLLDLRDDLDSTADALMEPCEVANVLQTVEEWIADGEAGQPRAPIALVRSQIVRAIVDARQTAKEDE